MAFLLLLSANVWFTVFWVLGLRTVTDVGKIGEPLQVFVRITFGPYWGKPILLCAPCMSSFWGMFTSFIMLLLFNNEFPLIAFIALYPLTAICAAFPVALLWNIYNKM